RPGGQHAVGIERQLQVAIASAGAGAMPHSEAIVHAIDSIIVYAGIIHAKAAAACGADGQKPFELRSAIAERDLAVWQAKFMKGLRGGVMAHATVPIARPG